VEPQAVSEAFGLGRALWLSEPVARGELGEIRRLETERGSWAIKRAFEPGDEPAHETSTDYHRQCWEAGLPTPEPVRAVSGSFVAAVAGEHLRAYAWVDLEGPDRGLDPVEVGELVAALHAVKRPARGVVHEWFEAPIGARVWTGVLEASRVVGAPYADRLAQLLPAIIEVETILTPMAAVQWCHLDLWSDNVRRAAGGGLCVFDFDNSGPADPGRELAMVVFEFGRGDEGRWRAVYDAYRAAGGSGRVTGRDSCAMTVAQLHHIGHRHVEMWLAARDDAGRERSLAGIEEFLGEPLLLPEVDRIVAGLR
jgi:hypothetical protein